MFVYILIFSWIWYIYSLFSRKPIPQKSKRFTISPILYPNIWTCYKKQQGHFWTEDNIDYTQDVVDWKKMHPDLQKVYKMVFAIFSFLDCLVNENISSIEEDLPDHYLEAKAFLHAQEAMEDIHQKTYSDIIEILLPEERDELLKNAGKTEYVKKKVELTCRRRGSNVSLAERIIANGCVEGIGFSGLFAPIFWLKGNNLLPGVRFANEEIITDESIHLEGAREIYESLVKDGEIERLSQNSVEDIVEDFVEVEIECTREILSVKDKAILRDLTIENMAEYIKFVADFYLKSLGYKIKYGAKNPFPFMDATGLITKSNFFEKSVAEYKQTQLNDTSANEIKTDLKMNF